MELGEEVKRMDIKTIMDDAFILKEHLAKIGGSVISVSLSTVSNMFEVLLDKEFYENIKEQFAGVTEYTKGYKTTDAYYEKGFIKDGINYFCMMEGDINEL